ncbi:DUF932 domain-containing protein [Citrobacter freundii]
MTRLASRFGAANIIRRDRPLTREELFRVVPSVFSEDKHESRSERYTYIPTISLLDSLQREGFQPFFACQTRVRDPERREHTKHMLRLRREGQITGKQVPEIILLNSHDGSSSYCRLRTAGSEMQMVPDVLIFAHRSGMAGLFPGFDRRLVNALLMCDESPCVIAPASPAPSPSGALSFWRLIQAITGRRRVTLIAEGQRCERLAPCRLLIHQQAWYLVAEHDGHIAVFTLNEIHLVQPLQESFRRNDSLCSLVEDPVFIQALPHFRFIQQSLLAFVPADSPPE